jgi:addiction module RelE/StbE family toxin
MKVFWSSAAEQDRADIVDRIGLDNPMAAIRMDELFAAAASRLAQHPMLGHPGIVPGTRELIPHESYRLVYEVEGDVAWILTLVHTARNWPDRRPQLGEPAP